MENIIHVIPAWDKKHGEAVLFFPSYAANFGNIVCYAHIGQHSEASLEYYRKDCRSFNSYFPKEKHEINALLDEYKSNFLEEGETLEIRSRDTAKFRKERYAHAK